MAEWLGKGLQNPVRRFESARHLHKDRMAIAITSIKKSLLEQIALRGFFFKRTSATSGFDDKVLSKLLSVVLSGTDILYHGKLV